MSDYLCHTIFCSTHSLINCPLLYCYSEGLHPMANILAWLPSALGQDLVVFIAISYIYLLRGEILVTQCRKSRFQSSFATNPSMSLHATASQSIKQREIRQPPLSSAVCVYETVSVNITTFFNKVHMFLCYCLVSIFNPGSCMMIEKKSYIKQYKIVFHSNTFLSLSIPFLFCFER